MAIQAQFPSCGLQDWMDSGCGGVNQFYFNVQQQKQLLQQQQHQCNSQQIQNQQQQQRNQSIWFDSVSSSFKNNHNSSYLSMDMASLDEKQRQEIDQYIRLQNERFRLLLQEQRRQQLALLLKRIESKALPLLRQKDEEIAQAAKRTMELEDFLKKLEEENQAWQRVAQENEAVVMSLNHTIEQIRENAFCCFNNGAGDAESCCDGNREVETEEVNRGFVDDNIKEQDKERKMMMMACKVCNSRNSCILFLPCRHLCSCKTCEAFLDSCPVCQTAKKASIEALMV